MNTENNSALNELEELKETVARLQSENDRLDKLAKQSDAANKAKSDFLAMISHEIRTPMNGVIGLTELLIDTELGKKQKHYAGLILTSARNLLTLINSLLDFSKIEAEMMELDIAEFNLKKLAGELMMLYSVATERKNIEVFAEIDPRVADMYLGDSYRVRQILVNLLGNATKFTEQGSVVLKIIYEQSVDDVKDMLRFEIRDSGPGIPSDKLGRLFKPFTQVDTSSTRRFGGTGLGLSICQKLVELMRGEIGVESQMGKGSTFWFAIPLKPVEGEARDHYEPSELAIPVDSTVSPDIHQVQEESSDDGPLFLIVDDDETNRFVLESVLLKAGARVLNARNGRSAIELHKEHDPDLTLMDCQMPIMDGFEASLKIHESAEQLSRKRPRIIALTADATQSTRQHCKEVGMDDYLTKPLEFGKLQRVIDNWLPGSGLRVVSHRQESENDESASYIKDDEFQDIQIDTNVLERLKESMGDISPVVSVFLDSLPTRLEELKKAIENTDYEEVRRVSHQLKGSSSQFGAVQLSMLCFQMENMGKNKQLDKVQTIYDKITQAANQVTVFLTEELDK